MRTLKSLVRVGLVIVLLVGATSIGAAYDSGSTDCPTFELLDRIQALLARLSWKLLPEQGLVERVNITAKIGPTGEVTGSTEPDPPPSDGSGEPPTTPPGE